MPAPKRNARATLLVAACCLVGCGNASPDGRDLLSPLQATTHVADRPLVYRVGWSWEGAVRDGDAYRFTSDEGVEVWIDSVTLTTTTMELVPCFEVMGVLELVVPWWASVARADHAGDSDVSLVQRILVQEGVRAEEELYGMPTLERGVEYCDVYRLHRAEAPESPGEDRVTLSLRGRYLLPGGRETNELALSTELDVGASVELGTRERPSTTQNVDEVVVLHRGAELFDGIEDPATLSQRELAYQILRNASRNVDVEIRSGDD